MTEHRAPRRIMHGHLLKRRASHSYGYVLLLIGISFLFAATAPDAAWATSLLVLLQTITLCAGLWTSGLVRAGSLVVVGAISTALIVAVIGLFQTDSTFTGLLALLSGMLTISTVVVLALGIVEQNEINSQSVTGAICIYILIGMIFVFVYGASAAFGHGAFFAQGTDGTRSLRLYFSYVTLATLGYGDYTPAGNFGHAAAIIEALFGQIYLVTVVAVLVTRMRPRREREPS